MSQEPNHNQNGLDLPKPQPALQEARPEASSPAMSPSSATSYSPPPSAASPSAGGKPGRWRLAILGAAVAAGLVFGGWYMMAPTPPASLPAATAVVQAQKNFSLAKIDADLKATAYLKDFLAGKTAEASAADPLHAANAEALKKLATANPKLAADIQSGRSVLYRIYLLDFLQEDGDRVELSVNGVSYGDIYIQNAGKELLIPLTAGVPAQVKLTATADGGGGVTVGFVSSLGEARTQTMRVGQSENWVVTVQ